MPDIPPHLLQEIKEGKCILLLGSGASREALNPEDQHPPMGSELARMLSSQFLGGNYADLPLDQVSELAVSESDLTMVQEYIRTIFERFEPTEAHLIMTTFKWEGLATTNYDRLIELAYERSTHPVQTPQPFIEDGDRIQDRMRDPNNVKLLKLHGCITKTGNPNCPLILTVDQYLQYKDGRKRLFGQLYEWASERSIVFVGQSLRDFDLRHIILELISEGGERRPKYYAVAPNIDPIVQRFWETKRITCISTTFLDFMRFLDRSIPSPFRGLRMGYSSASHPIVKNFVKADGAISERCKRFLDVEVDYVRQCTQNPEIDPKKFYRGIDLGWAAIEQNLDVRRRLSDEILSDLFLDEPVEQKKTPNIILINAYAGAGKSILLKRIAWDAAHDYDRICLFLRPYGQIDLLALQELVDLCKKRIFLFVDNAADHVHELQQVVENAGPEGAQITILLAERTNEWNMVGEEYQGYISTSYELSYLTEREIDALLALLEKHRALGTLERSTLDERRAAFKKRAGRQILVALHEATLGKPFEEIVVDEFKNIRPPEAQAMYLSVCVLNRLNVGVRAGIISRSHGIRFEDFRTKFFRPLEDVVQTSYDPVARDNIYSARHPHIADIVFINVLRNQEERYDAYIRCLKALNIDYGSDRSAFRQMIRAKSLLDIFSNPALIKEIYRISQKTSDRDPFVLQQMAIFEMHHSAGDISLASELLRRAQALAPRSMAIKHSLSEVHLLLAEQAHTELQLEKELSEAEAIAASLVGKGAQSAHPYHTLCKVGLKRIQNIIKANEGDFSHAKLELLIKSIERYLSEGLQRFPEDPYLLIAESQLAELLADSTRALSALKKAFEANPRNSWFAVRLSRTFQKAGDLLKAKEVLKKGLEANANSHELHFAFAKLIFSEKKYNSDEIIYHLRRSFSPGDSNLDAQTFYARELYSIGKIIESKQVFESIQGVGIGPEAMNRIRYPLDGEYSGSISKQEASYCFIQRDGPADWVFAHKNNTDPQIWDELVQGVRVRFRIGFTIKGSTAFNVCR